MRKQILEALKAKFTGVSEEILGRIADKLAKTATTAEQVQTAVDGVSFQQVLESYGDSRATEAQKTAVSNYEKKHGLKDGKKVEEPKPKPAEGGAEENILEDVPAWAKALIKSNTQLTERLNKMDSERTTASRRQQLDSIIEKLPEDLRKAYQRTSVDNLKDEEFNSLLTDVKTEVDGIVSTINAKGAVFGRPAAGAGQQSNEQLTEAQIKAINTRANVNAEDQPF